MGSTPLSDDRSPWMKSRSPGLTHRQPLKLTRVSPSLKDTLRQGCLERARRKLQGSIWKSRRRHDPDTSKQLVQDEMRESGVTIRREKEPPTPSLYTESVSLWEGDYSISESEMYELMQEVEKELQRDVEAKVEDVMEEMELCERLNAQHIEDQIADFQDWEISQRDDFVLCPICKDGNLISLSGHGVVCPNHMNGSCALRFEGDTIVMSNLRERLRTAYEVHSCACSSLLDFEVGKRDDGAMLLATCIMCDSIISIL